MERHEDRLLICTQCERCGARKVVSAADGSLEEWEEGHRCEKLFRKRDDGETSAQSRA
jgi:hypothetical protein